MLKLLIKKQFFESFKSYFVNLKTGKLKTKGQTIRSFALFFLVLLLLGFSFFGMSMMMSETYSSIPWLSYAIFSIMSISVSTIIVMFLASNILYKSKDNDQLLSMPINQNYILISRMLVLYVLSTLYSSVVYLPICLNSWIHGINSPLAIILSLLNQLVIGLIVTTLASVCGYVVFTLSNKFKNKALGSVLFSIVILGVYYVVYFRLNKIFEDILIYQDKIAETVKHKVYYIYCLAKGATGDILSFVIFLVISIVFFGLIYFVISKNFIKAITSDSGNTVKAKKITYTSQSSVIMSLMKKELSRFLNCAVYMMNAGLGIMIVIFAAVFTVIKRSDIATLIDLLKNEIPEVFQLVPLLLVGSVLLIISLDLISTPSISLEGKNFYILKTLPIKASEVLKAKEMFHVFTNGIPTILSSIVIFIFFKVDMDLIAYMLLIIFFYVEVQSLVGLVIGVSRVDLNWTTETEPIKQSLNVLFAMLICWAMIAIIVCPYLLLKDTLLINDYMFAIIIVLIIITLLLRRWLNTKGVEKFNNI